MRLSAAAIRVSSHGVFETLSNPTEIEVVQGAYAAGICVTTMSRMHGRARAVLAMAHGMASLAMEAKGAADHRFLR